MILMLLPLIALCFYKIKIHKTFNEAYLGKEQTGAMKGIFAVMIFFTHVVQYMQLEDTMADKLYDYGLGVFGQNIVIVFLLYSGYGIGKAYLARGKAYIQALPRNRILPTWLHFVLAILLFWALDLLLIRGGYSALDYIHSLFAWKSVGNSTWFVFAILLCWILTYALFSAFKKKYHALGVLTVLLCVYIVVIKALKDNNHAWYDTILCYPLGLLLAFEQERVDRFFRSGIRGIAAIVLLGIGWVGMRLFVSKNVFTYELQSILFALFILALTSRVTVYNKILAWLGKHSFSIYILQRIPMLALDHFGVSQTNRAVFILASAALTGVFAVAFDFVTDQLDKKLKKEVVKA